MPRFAIEIALTHISGLRDPLTEPHEWYVMPEFSFFDSDDAHEKAALWLSEAIEAGYVDDAVISESLSQRDAFWAIRESIPEAQTRAGGSIKHDVSVAISDLPKFIDEGSALCKKIAPEGVLVIYGHLGDGSLHFNINTPDTGAHPEFFAKKTALNNALHELTRLYRGSISAEHGIGQLKRDELATFKNPVALEVMRTIKQTFDPHGIMNPGKVINADNDPK